MFTWHVPQPYGGSHDAWHLFILHLLCGCLNHLLIFCLFLQETINLVKLMTQPLSHDVRKHQISIKDKVVGQFLRSLVPTSCMWSYDSLGLLLPCHRAIDHLCWDGSTVKCHCSVLTTRFYWHQKQVWLTLRKWLKYGFLKYMMSFCKMFYEVDRYYFAMTLHRNTEIKIIIKSFLDWHMWRIINKCLMEWSRWRIISI